MRAALWETSTGALASLLDSRQPLEMTDLHTVTLAGGTVFRWSGHDVPLSDGTNTWILGPGIKRSRVRFAVGVDVDSMQITLTDNAETTIGGLPLLQFIRAGGLVGAQWQVDRAFGAFGDSQPRGALLWFAGRVAGVRRIDRYAADLTVKSDLQLLDVSVPRDVYQTGCLNTLYDASCGASRSAFLVTGSASGATNSARTTFAASGLAQAAGYFDLGVIVMTSGAASGQQRTVKLHTTGSITVIRPWTASIAPGDTFSIWPGCNKSPSDANGCPKFFSTPNVKLHYRGHPYIPKPETVF